MRKQITWAIVAAALGGSHAAAADEPGGGPERKIIIKFLREHVIGKTVEARVTTRLDAGKTETDFSRRTTYANLAETPSGFAFDALLVIRQTIFDLDAKGLRVEPGLTHDRVLAIRYEVSERKSTGRLTGTGRLLSMSTPDHDSTGYAEFVRFRAEGDRVVMDLSTVGYADFFASKGRYKPGVSDTESVFSVVGGKLRVDETEHNFYVDPDSMGRTPTGDPVKLGGGEVP